MNLQTLNVFTSLDDAEANPQNNLSPNKILASLLNILVQQFNNRPPSQQYNPLQSGSRHKPQRTNHLLFLLAAPHLLCLQWEKTTINLPRAPWSFASAHRVLFQAHDILSGSHSNKKEKEKQRKKN